MFGLRPSDHQYSQSPLTSHQFTLPIVHSLSDLTSQSQTHSTCHSQLSQVSTQIVKLILTKDIGISEHE